MTKMKTKSKKSSRSDEAKRHENQCKQCGKCCRIKVERFDGTVVALEEHCTFLDTKTKKCVIYKQRRQLKQQVLGRKCLTIWECMAQGLLPNDCGYVKNHPEYKCVVDVWDD